MKQDFYKNRRKVLKIREEFLLENPDCLKGNTKERNQYVAKLVKLSPKLASYQFDMMLGLVLSDASLQRNASKTTSRIKMQMTYYKSYELKT